MGKILTKNRDTVRIASLIAITIIIPTISCFRILSAEPKKEEGVALEIVGYVMTAKKCYPLDTWIRKAWQAAPVRDVIKEQKQVLEGKCP